MMKRFLSILMGIIISGSVFSQNNNYYDVIRLKNGSVIKGTITENKVNDQIKILLGGRQTLTFSYEEIASIRSLNHQYLARLNNPGKYYNKTELGVSFDRVISNFNGDKTIGSFFTFRTSHGIWINPSFAAAAGIGLDYYESIGTFPYYLSVVGVLKQGRVRPYYQANIGKAKAWERNLFDNSGVEDVKGKLFFQPAVGLMIAFESVDLSLQLSYKLQKATIFFGDFGFSQRTDMTLRTVDFSVGLGF